MRVPECMPKTETTDDAHRTLFPVTSFPVTLAFGDVFMANEHFREVFDSVIQFVGLFHPEVKNKLNEDDEFLHELRCAVVFVLVPMAVGRYGTSEAFATALTSDPDVAKELFPIIAMMIVTSLTDVPSPYDELPNHIATRCKLGGELE